MILFVISKKVEDLSKRAATTLCRDYSGKEITKRKQVFSESSEIPKYDPYELDSVSPVKVT